MLNSKRMYMVRTLPKILDPNSFRSKSFGNSYNEVEIHALNCLLTSVNQKLQIKFIIWIKN